MSRRFRSIVSLTTRHSINGARGFPPFDAAYYLAYHVDQPRPDALVVTCEDCSGAYLPLG